EVTGRLRRARRCAATARASCAAAASSAGDAPSGFSFGASGVRGSEEFDAMSPGGLVPGDSQLSGRTGVGLSAVVPNSSGYKDGRGDCATASLGWPQTATRSKGARIPPPGLGDAKGYAALGFEALPH